MIANLKFWCRCFTGISFCFVSLKLIYCIINGVPRNFYENAATVTCCSCGAAICVPTRAGGRAVDLGGQAFIRGGQSLKLSTNVAVFKRVSLLIGGSSMSIGIKSFCIALPDSVFALLYLYISTSSLF